MMIPAVSMRWIKKHLSTAGVVGYTSPVTEKNVIGICSPSKRGHSALLFVMAVFLCPKHGIAPFFGRVMQGAARLAGSFARSANLHDSVHFAFCSAGTGNFNFLAKGAPL